MAGQNRTGEMKWTKRWQQEIYLEMCVNRKSGNWAWRGGDNRRKSVIYI